MSEYFRKPIVKTLMLKGQAGQSVKGIKKTGTSGFVDTYTITLTDGTTSTFTVTNGKGISSIRKTGTNGLVDTYTTTYTDGTTSTFMITNGEGLQNLQVGGRNLYLGTKDFSGSSWFPLPSWGKKEEKYNGLTVMARTGRWDGLCQTIEVKAGERYIFSCYVKNTADPSTHIVITNTNIANRATVDNTFKSIEKSPDFQKVSLTFLVLSDGVISPRVETDSGTAEICVCGMKLERGGVATDWTPAPEDLETTAITNAEIDNIVK